MNKETIKNWLKKPENLAILVVFLLVFGIRLYYFAITINQPVWWDEGEYLSSAKNFAGIVKYNLGGIRLPGFPLVLSLFFMLGANEPLIRFLVLFIPSLIVIFLSYFLIKEMYPNKKIALISTAILGVLWEHLFYSNRFHTENAALIFQFLAIFILFKVYIKKQDWGFIKLKHSFLWIALFSIIAVLFRPGNLIFIPALFAFILLLNKSKFFTKKVLFSILGLIIITLLFFAKFPTLISLYYQPQNPLAFNTLSVFYGFYQSIIPNMPSIMFYAFLIGLLVFVIDFSTEKLRKIDSDADTEFKSDIFNILLLISVMACFIIIIRPSPSFEFRWFFPFLPAFLAFTSKGVVFFSEIAGGVIKSKKIIPMLIILILALGMYTQLYRADMIIEAKIGSYSPIKNSGLWIKENSLPSDSIITASLTQHTYYSERNSYDFYVNGKNDNSTLFEEKVLQLRPKYIVISTFELGFTPDWIIQSLNSNDGSFIVLMPYTNSSIVISQDNQATIDMKSVIEKKNFNLILVYPQNQINWVFIYKVDYK